MTHFKKPKSYLEAKQYFKERQILYNKMKSINIWKDGVGYPIVDIDGIRYENSIPELATHVFIWFDRKPFIAFYDNNHKSYYIGTQRMHISNPNKKTNRVIAFVKQIENE